MYFSIWNSPLYFKWEIPRDTKRQRHSSLFFYVSRESGFKQSSRKFKLRLHQSGETSEHKQALEKCLLKDVATLNRSARPNGNFDCSRYRHTQANCWSCNRSYSTSEATERQASAEVTQAHPGSCNTHRDASPLPKLIRTKALLDIPYGFHCYLQP